MNYTIQAAYAILQQQLAKAITDREDLLLALKNAVKALDGGLWDYGPGQDEHKKCNQVILECQAVIAQVAGGS